MKSFLGGIADAFGDSNFRRYSVGSIVSWLSFFVQAVAVSWTTWNLTHSTRWLAIVALMDAAPNIVLMPLGGVVADRYDRLQILLISYAMATLQAATLAWLAFAGQLTIGLLSALAFLHGAIHAFSIPAQFGLLPRFIERRRLSSAIAVAAAYTQFGIFAGPALAGWLILHFGTAIAFATNVVGYGIFFCFIALLRTPAGYEQPGASGNTIASDFLDGLHAMRGHRGIMAILALMLFADALAAAVRQMAPAFADSALGTGVEGLSTLLACGGVGATLSALWLAHGGARRTTPPIILSGFLGFLVALVTLMLAQSLTSAALAMIGLGCFFEICRTGTVALLQISVPDALRSRIMSTQFLLMRLAGMLGVVLVGVVAETWGVRAPMLCFAAVALLVWGGAFRVRERIVSAFAARGG